MKTINNTASRIIVDGGSVEYILDLLEDPEDAATNLKPAMRRMEESSLQCKEDIEKLTKQFDYWYWVICSLKKNTLDSRGMYPMHSKALWDSEYKCQDTYICAREQERCRIRQTRTKSARPMPRRTRSSTAARRRL